MTNETLVTKQQMVPVIFASMVGTAIEWYDFFLYNTVAALVFPKLFFPQFSPLAGTLLAFTTYLVGFVARPLGGAIFGHLGDRIGRKSTLVATLLLMGVATLAVGFVPSYAAIGVAAPLIVSLFRFCQGLGVGGEWGGSVLLVMEYGHKKNRGFWSSFPQAGVLIGLLLSSLAVSLASSYSGEHFVDWGWRIPFYFSSVLILIGMYIRLKLHETPLFSQMVAEGRGEKTPVREVIARNWREILLSAGSRFVEQAPFYIFTAFVLVYGVKQLHLSKQLLLLGVNIAAALQIITIPVAGHLSDRYGRRLWYLCGCALMAACLFPYFMLLNTRQPIYVILGIVLSLPICHATVYGPQAALISERFDTQLRYSGASLGYQLAAPFAGGLAPIIATALLSKYHGSYVPIAIYIILMALISFLSVLGLKELTQADISGHVDNSTPPFGVHKAIIGA